MNKLFYTLKDIGYYRISLRIRYVLRRKLDLLLSDFFLKKLYFTNYNLSKWKSNNLKIRNSSLEPIINKISIDNYEFKFLNNTKKLYHPINWNDNSWNRLWRFNLHYFEWMREIIENALLKDKWCEKAIYINTLLDQWIFNNPIGKGDGWHSYTISLRVRNWVWLFNIFPEYATEMRIKSLWEQICWLDKHPEKYLGGNHWLENLITLMVGSLQFEGDRSTSIYRNALQNLEKELKKQILKDGGHEERSASYHLLLLDRLTELACVIKKTKKKKIKWLDETILKMTNFAECIQLKNNQFPIFNDSPNNGCPNIEIVINFAKSFLYGIEGEISPLRSLLLSNSNNFNSSFKEKYIKRQFKNNPITNLENTGWFFLRPNNHWELVIKYGKSCPKHLPGHAHSDTLSFDLFYDGKPIIVETGTSFYGDSLIRSYERSGQAHNIMQLARGNSIKDYKKIKWEESVDVWGNFRAGKKANCYNTHSKYSYEKKIFSFNSFHDGFHNIGANYGRSFEVLDYSKSSIKLKIVDYIECKHNFLWRQLWHLAPNQSKEYLTEIINQLKKLYQLNYFWKETWFSKGFGLREKRETLIMYGSLKKGDYQIPVELLINI